MKRVDPSKSWMENKDLNKSKASSLTDHRKSGKALEIFDLEEDLGSGMPVWLENGFTLKQIITSYINFIQKNNGITLVTTPELGRKELYEKSGHWDHYRENMFPTLKIEESEEYILRPMTCPHHVLLYQRVRRHENQLPISFGENAKLYRYEYSGGLFGLERTRCMELIDTHMFCAAHQISESLEKAWNMIQEVKEAFEINHHSIALALRSPNKEKFFDDDKLWEDAESTLKAFLNSKNAKYTEEVGDAAFYGPKIDFQIKTAANKIITISTIQLDFLLPKKFQISYINKNEEKATPIMIHVGIIGTLERFIAYLLERDQGWLPFWLSPIQIAIIPVNKSHFEFAQRLSNVYKKMNLRVSIEDSDKSLSKRLAQVIEKKIYSYIVVGDKEISSIDINALENIEEKALSGFNRMIKILSKSKNQGPDISEEKYPKNHIDFLRWASLNE